uniref:EGF-like domain-containing protein n=2 Tax=Sus scrofa TaxID=9823 RepID=A0A8D1E4X9_PIG
MASPPPLLLLLLPLLLLPPPAAPKPRNESEPPPPPALPPERHGPAPTGHRWTAAVRGTATRPEPSGRVPRGGSTAAMRNHWPESNTEPHKENMTFGPSQVDFSTVVSKEGVMMVQTPGKNHTSSEAPQNSTLQTETAAAEGRNDSLRRSHFTVSPVGPDRAAALTSQSITSAWRRHHLPSSSSRSEGRTYPAHTDSGTSQGSPAGGQRLPGDVTVHTQVAATSVLSQSSPPGLEMGEETTPARQQNSSGPWLSWMPFSGTPASSPPSDHSAPSGILEDLNNSTAVQHPSAHGTKSARVTTVPTGVSRMLQSLAVHPGPLMETEPFSEDTATATTSASAHSSPPEAESRRNSEVVGSPGDGAFMEPSTENAFGLTSSKVSVESGQNDSPTSGGLRLASSSGAGDGSPGSQTETVSRSAPLVRGGQSTALWFVSNSETLADAPGSSTAHPEVENASVLTRFSALAPQSGRSDTTLGGGSSEPDTESSSSSSSSSTSLDSWAPRGEHLTSGGLRLASSSGAGDGSPGSQTETVSRSAPLVRGGQSTALWFVSNSETLADAPGSSTAHPEVENASVLTRFSALAPQSGRSDTTLGGGSSEPDTESSSSSSSSSTSLDSWAPRGEHLTTEDSPELGVGSESEEGASEGASRTRAHRPHTLATLTGIGERTLRSLTNGSTTPGDAGRSEAEDTESATLQGNVTAAGDSHLVSSSLAASRTLGVTGTSSDPVHSTDPEHRTSGDYTDHTYVSAPFTKGERTLLSIADNSSAADLRESSTSSVKISNASHPDSSSPSLAQTERGNASSHKGEPALPSTEVQVLHTARPPSHTPTVILPSTLDAHADSVGDPSSSSSGPPLPPPSVSQSYHLFLSTVPSTGASTHQLQSTPDVPTPLSSLPPPSPASLTTSTPAEPAISQTTLPPLSSTLVPPRPRDAPVTSVWTLTMASSVAVLPNSQTADPKIQSNPDLGNVITESKLPSLETRTPEATEAVTVRSTLRIPSPPAFTEASTEETPPATSTSLAQTSSASTATTLKISHPPTPSPSPPSRTAAPGGGPTAAQTVAGKQPPPTSPEMLVVQVSTGGAVIPEKSQAHGDAAAGSARLTSTPTSAEELTTERGRAGDNSPAPHFLRTSPAPQTTRISTAEVVTAASTTPGAQSSTQSPTTPSSPVSVNSCTPRPCLHDGKCVVDPTTSRGHRCVCSPSWQGQDCSVDVNECLSNPCPPLATCNNTQGSFTCRCPVGYQLEKGICNLVRTFMTEFKLKKTFLNTTMEQHADLREVENEITKTLNVCFSTLPGYTRSTAHASREPSAVVMSLQSTFSLASNVTLFDLADGMQKCVNACRSSAEVCQLLGSQKRIFRAGSLCKRKTPECDKETSICTDLDGVALCQCKSGYFQFNKMDHSCRACEDGYRLENETCTSCPFGLGGLNCGNPYQLITVVIAAAGGGLLLILGIALIVTCCRKNKNDISKLIFKSGDFQMSPYAEYPKNPRSQEWGREAIEMHENGSTKNLLQMTDVYYSPTSVRNPELERNGLYPAYTGLPGSRHSCIFPGQYNPSFISDESRRRDYF